MERSFNIGRRTFLVSSLFAAYLGGASANCFVSHMLFWSMSICIHGLWRRTHEPRGCKHSYFQWCVVSYETRTEDIIHLAVICCVDGVPFAVTRGAEVIAQYGCFW